MRPIMPEAPGASGMIGPAARRSAEKGDKWPPARPARHNGDLTTGHQGARNAALCSPGHCRPSVGGMTEPNLATPEAQPDTAPPHPRTTPAARPPTPDRPPPTADQPD